MTRGDCVFCKIIARQERGHFICEDNLASALLTIGPVTPGHLMVIPNRHAETLADLTDDENTAIFRMGGGWLRYSGEAGYGVKASTTSWRTVKRHFRRSSTFTFTSFRVFAATPSRSTQTGTTNPRTRN